MIKLDFTQDIKAPVARVFAYVTDLRRAAEWQDDVVESTPRPNGRVHVGTKVKMVRLLMGERLEATGQVTEYVPNQKFALKTTSGPLRYSLSQTFASENGGTRLSTHMELDAADLMQISEGAIAAGLKQQFSQQEQKLKEILES